MENFIFCALLLIENENIRNQEMLSSYIFAFCKKGRNKNNLLFCIFSYFD